MGSITHLYTKAQSSKDSVLQPFEIAYKKIDKIISVNGSFKDAVYWSEWASVKNIPSYTYFYTFIKSYTTIAKKNCHSSKIINYKSNDSLNYRLNLAIFKTFTKKKQLRAGLENYTNLPFTYNFSDPQGDKDFTNTFVTKLLVTHQGNCRSLTYLYKILADEVEAKCWLALAPNHIYIRNFSKQIGWYNTELTSGTFPTDAWIATTGYIPTDAIRSGIYMDTLSNQQSIALCVLDLAHGNINQTNNYTDRFVLKCCNLVLQYHSINPEALLLKAETLKKVYQKQKQENNFNAQSIYNEMEQTYITLVKLGYRQMPYDVYQKWLKTVKCR